MALYDLNGLHGLVWPHPSLNGPIQPPRPYLGLHGLVQPRLASTASTANSRPRMASTASFSLYGLVSASMALSQPQQLVWPPRPHPGLNGPI